MKTKRHSRSSLSLVRRALDLLSMYKTVRGRSTRVNETKLSWLLVCVSRVVSRLRSRVSRRSRRSAVKQARCIEGFFFGGFFSLRGDIAEISRLHLGHAVLVQDAGEEGLGDVVAVVQRALERARAGLGVAAHAAP